MFKNPQIIQVVSYYPPHLGGMENCVAKISEILAKRRHNVEVYTSDQGYDGKNKNEGTLHVNYLRSIEIAHTPIIFSLFSRLMSASKNSVIHLHISQAFTPEVVYLISKIRKIPYVAHIHLDVDASGKLGFLLTPYKKYFLSRALRNANKVICQSIEQKTLIGRKYNLKPGKIVIIPNGVGSEFFIKRKPSKNSIPHLLFVGRLSSQKNIPLIVRALSQVKQDVHLDIVGEGEEKKDIEKLIEDLKLKNVTLHGKKTGKELLNQYASSDVFILCSEKEGISLAMLEAMASGLPVIGANVHGLHELVGESGILIDNPTPEKLSTQIDSLLSSPAKLKKLSVSAVKKAKKYSWEKVVNEIEKTYQEVSGGN